MNHQLSRRYFLQASTVMALSQLLGGCGSEAVTQILFLENSVPPQLIRDFRKSFSQLGKVEFKPQTYIPQIFDSLFALQYHKDQEQQIKKTFDRLLNRSKVYPNLTTLGDSWLSTAIKQKLIQPLSSKYLSNWQNLPSSWQKLVLRNPQGDLDSNGAIYGAPYRWGSAVIAYRRDKLKPLNINIKDWQDLWQPELRDRISLLDSPREVIGLTLKKLGQSYNTDDLNVVTELEAELLALHQQAKLYSSDHYLEPLVLGDTWAAVAWSTDILSLTQRYPEIEFIIPQSGTSLWADLWVKPQLPQAQLVADSETDITTDKEGSKGIIEEWIDYCWQPKTATQISLFTNGVSPILTNSQSIEIPPNLQDNVFINSPVLNSDKSEFLLPLTPAAEKQYRDLWLKVRQPDV
ncbi:MAG: extracellular solute-binding protein [Cyanobacteria bacterium J06648_1]